MCGICGFYGFSDKTLLKKMCNKLQHRGPDESGMYIDDSVGLGHQRLSIIDIVSGRQPIHNEDGSIWIIFNGEIYNYKGLRTKLENKHTFYTKSDTEVVVHLYEDYGSAGIKKLRGMFAFAIWDSNKKKLFLVRDRLGIKPLFYMIHEDYLFFASELKAILEYEEFKREVDLGAVNNFLKYRFNCSNQTLIKGIKKLPRAHYMEVYQDKITIQKYWTPTIIENSIYDESYLANKLLDILRESVKMHLISDVPLGVYLSGGIDSSSVVGLMKEWVDEPRTFSIGFEGDCEDELKFAKIVAEYYGTDHHEIIVKPDVVKLLPKIIWHLEEPMADLATIPVYLLSENAKKDVTVVLTGEGNDEIWAGYDHYQRMLKFEKIMRFIPQSIRNSSMLQKIADTIPSSKLRDKVETGLALIRSEYGLYSEWAVFKKSERKDMLDIKNEIYSVQEYSPVKTVNDDIRNRDLSLLNKLLIYDINTILTHCFLVKADRMTMAKGVEARVPLIDNKLVEFAFTVPPTLKLYNGIEKYLFRKAVKNVLPPKITYRKKRGFGVPLGLWLNEMKEYAIQILDEEGTKKRGLIEKDFLEKMSYHLRNKEVSEGEAVRVWSLVNLELWCRMFINGEKSCQN